MRTSKGQRSSVQSNDHPERHTADARRASSAPRDGEVTFSGTVSSGALTVYAPPPELLSQRTVEAHTGISRGVYLDLLPEYRAAGGAVSHVGKLRLVDRRNFVDFLRARGREPRAAAATAAAGAIAKTATELFAMKLGLVARGGGSR